MKDDTRAQLVEAVDKAYDEIDEAMWECIQGKTSNAYKTWLEARGLFEDADQALAAYDLARLRENDNAK